MRAHATKANKSPAAGLVSPARLRGPAAPPKSVRENTISCSRIFSFDFSRIRVHSGAHDSAPGCQGPRLVPEKSVDDESDGGDGFIKEKGPDAGLGSGDAGVPAPAKKSAGVDSFTVQWSKHSTAGPTVAKLRLDYTATFKNDATHDPALAEFRQSVFTKYEITAGPNKGAKGDTSPVHDDNYSRADDTSGNAKTSTKFQSNDNPGIDTGLDKDDVLDYSFTAEQTIIDTSDGNKVLSTKGPHTGTIKGKDPRAYAGVPTTL